MKKDVVEELLKSAKQREAYLEDVLKRLDKTQDVIPIIQGILEQTRWEVKTLEDMPEGADEFLPATVINRYSAGNEFISKNIPLPPQYEVDPVYSTASVTVSGTTDVYTSVSRASEIESPIIIKEWANTAVGEYRGLQEKQARYEQVLDKLNGIDPHLSERLNLAYKTYKSASANAGERISAGIAMRNLLEQFKGSLWEQARLRPKEKMSWQLMSERLTKGEPDDPQHRELQKQEEEWRSLQVRLTAVAKAQDEGLVTNLDDIWVKLIDHLFTVLGIVKIL